MSSRTHAIADDLRGAVPAAAGARWRTRGWAIVGALSVTETVSYGVLYYAFAAFLVPMQQDLGYSLAALASFIFVPLAQVLIEAYGWRDALVVLAVIRVITVPLHALVLRAPPSERRGNAGGASTQPAVVLRSGTAA